MNYRQLNPLKLIGKTISKMMDLLIDAIFIVVDRVFKAQKREEEPDTEKSQK